MQVRTPTLFDRALSTRIGGGVAALGRSRWLLETAGAAAMVLMIAISAIYALAKPDYNWDMIAYVGAALEPRFDDAASLHAETWRQVDVVVPADQQQALKFGDDYRRAQWENPDDFQSQLGMYRVKAGYIALIRALEPVAGVVRGAMLLSIACSVAFGLLCLWILWREKVLQGGLVLAPALLIAGYGDMTSSVAPDMLLALVSLAALYALFKGYEIVGCILLFAATLARPDALILTFALLLAAILFNWRKGPILLAFVASFALAETLSYYGGHPGWWAHFYFSTVSTQVDMAGFHPDFSLVAFAKGYVRGVMESLHSSAWPGLLVLMTVCWLLLAQFQIAGDRRTNGLLFAVAIGTLGKFASFPLPDDRFYFPFIAGMALLLVLTWKPRFDRVAER